MTTYTRAELATRVLQDLGLLGSDETPTSEELAFAVTTVASVTAQLLSEGIFIWGGSDQSLPEEYLVQLSKRIGLDIGPSYGLFSIPESETAKPIVNMSLRSIGAKSPTYTAAQGEYL